MNLKIQILAGNTLMSRFHVGFEIELPLFRYDKEDGWNENKRQKFRENQQYSLTQSQKMPGYTKFGYQKMKIPKQLYDLIYEARYEAKMSIEKCEFQFHNCQRIKSDGTLGKYN